jgi:hypothetical protein
LLSCAPQKAKLAREITHPNSQPEQHAKSMRTVIAIAFFSLTAFSQTARSQTPDIVKTLLPDGDPARLVMPKPSERPQVIRQLRAARVGAEGSYAQQAAFLLAVFGADYERSRDYLLWAMKGCDVIQVTRGCDDMTGEYLIYLYEHGHPEILAPLLRAGIDDYNAAGSEGLGGFFADLVVKSPSDFLAAIRPFPPSTQNRICTFAGYSDGGGLAPQDLRKLRIRMGRMDDQVARRCLRQIEAANKPDQK